MGKYRKYLLDNDAVYVTAKVDGSNGCVFWDDEIGAVAAGSRNFQLSEGEDNAFFHAWLNGGSKEAELLKDYCRENPSRIVYGEWMGRDRLTGAFKHYDKAALGTLVIFDVFDAQEDAFLADPEWRAELSGYGLEPYFVRLLAVLDHPSMEDVIRVAKANDFLIEGTGLVGEGVVCKAPDWRNRFGRIAYGKIVLDEFRKQRKPAPEASDVEAEIVELYLTDAELEKAVAKVCVAVGSEEFDSGSRKMMGMLTSMCWKDLLAECPNWTKRMKNPTVDFGRLSGLCSAKVKEHVDARRNEGSV